MDTGLAIVSSQTLPMFVNLFVNADPTRPETEALTDDDKPVLVVGFGGDPETVAWQLTQCQGIMEQNGAIGVTIVEDESLQHLQEAVQEFSADNKNTERVVAKLNLKRTDLTEFAAQIGEANWARDVQMMALLGSGVLYVTMPVCSRHGLPIACEYTDPTASNCNVEARKSHHRSRTS